MDVNRATLRRIFLSVVVPVILSVLASILIYRVIMNNSASLRAVSTSYERISAINRLMKTVLDAETGMRGFIITGNEAFLEPYNNSVISIGSELSSLRRLMNDDESEAAFNEIDRTLEGWRREVAEVVIDLRRDLPKTLLSSSESAYTNLLEARRAEAQYRQSASSEALVTWSNYASKTEDALEQIGALPLRGSRAVEIMRLKALFSTYNVRLSVPNAQPGPADEAAADELMRNLRAFSQSIMAEEFRLTSLLQSGVGKVRIDKIRSHVDTIQRRADTALQANLRSGELDTRQAQIVSFGGPIAAAIFGLVAVVLSQRSLNRSAWRLTRITQDVSNGEFDKRLYITRNDELWQLARNFNAMAADLGLRERQAALLGQMGKLLQTCSSSEELYSINNHFAADLFPGYSGTLYIISASRNLLQPSSSWGTQRETEQIYDPEACWALRQGQTHLSKRSGSGSSVACLHAPTPEPFESLCIPLISRDETLGIFYLYTDEAEAIPTGIRRLAATVAEQLGLALSNLRLREKLRNQSIRDPLTGLFNRRHLEETLDLELHRAARRNEAISLVMFDVDHFKRYNDTFGHDAGDVVLQSLSALVRQHIRAGDVACRYGGEEFLLVQPGLGLPAALERAEALRQEVMALELEYQDKRLGQITISVGVALYPDHGGNGADLIRRADEALYRAKRGGRNQVLLAETATTPHDLPSTDGVPNPSLNEAEVA